MHQRNKGVRALYLLDIIYIKLREPSIKGVIALYFFIFSDGKARYQHIDPYQEAVLSKDVVFLLISQQQESLGWEN